MVGQGGIDRPEGHQNSWTSNRPCFWNLDHWLANCVAVGPEGTSLYHSSQERDCDSRAVQMYTLDIRSHIFAIQDQWRGNESRWHYLRDRFTAALNYRAKLIYKCPYSFSWNTKKCLGIFGKLYHYMRPMKGHHKDGHPLFVFPVWGRWEEGSRVNDPSGSLASLLLMS